MTQSVNLKVGGVWKTTTVVKVKIAGTWRVVTGIYGKVGGSWKPFLGSGGGAALTLTQQVATVSGSRSGPGSCTSGTATGIRTNGTAAFTFAWTRISGDASMTVTSPTAISTTFSATLADGQTKSAVYRLTVTDGTTATAFADVTVNLVSSATPPPPPPPPPASLTVSISPRASVVSRTGAGFLSQDFGVSVSGGNGSYIYSWSVPGTTLINGTTSSPSAGISNSPPYDNTFGVSVSVSDTGGASGSDSTTVEFIINAAPPPPPPPPPLSVVVSPDPNTQSHAGGGPCFFTFNATPSNGTPPYTYAWSGGASGSGTSITFSKNAPNGDQISGTETCTVTDNVGATASASAEWIANGF
jgi:hypothetical protein